MLRAILQQLLHRVVSKTEEALAEAPPGPAEDEAVTSEPVEAPELARSASTVPLSRTAPLPMAAPFPPQFWVGTALDVGLHREHNEDTLYAYHSVIAGGQDEALPLGLFVVADGMGGHLHGEEASRIAVTTFVQYLWQHWLHAIHGDLHPSPPESDLASIMEEAVVEAHHAVQANVPGGGTTLTAVFAWNRRLMIAHVGDSRAYLFDPKTQTLRRLTTDHSWYQRLLDQGQISPEEAEQNTVNRNVLYQALGQGGPLENIEISIEQWEPGMTLLVCSDGLWDVVSDEDIQRTLQWAPSPMLAAYELVEKARAHGGPDNISVICATFLPVPSGTEEEETSPS
ncbi:MAG: serine/threonine-protein phosphatase [Chloroflexi bacterium]|nr:serine/threonine-protein phosphatase [Chloroflexota bacterium]